MMDVNIHAATARRAFLQRSAFSIGSIALGQLLAEAAPPATPRIGMPGALPFLHKPQRIKRIIHLCMAGGPSQLETFDWKPELKKLHGQPFPSSYTNGQQLAQLQNTPLLARGPFTEFSRHGKSGIEISSLLPNIARHADKLAVIRSMVTEQINHDPAHAFFNSGSILKGRPSMGSWLLYGLGSESRDLPGFVVLASQGSSDGVQPVSARQWSAGFLPSRYQGVPFQAKGDAVHYVASPGGNPRNLEEKLIQSINAINRERAAQTLDPEAATRIAQYEMAFRMQLSVPELTDMKDERPETLQRYGIKRAGDGTFASNCLLARRLLERGVRCVQVYHRAWDHHRNMEVAMPIAARETDAACAALLDDLEQRGMLDSTLVVWGGEFGRTPMGQGTGRDHHINAFSIWMAGGGIKGGTVYGSTDELGYRAVEDVVTVHDLHATVLHLFGIDHERFSVKFQGLDARLTGVEPAKVVVGVLA